MLTFQKSLQIEIIHPCSAVFSYSAGRYTTSKAASGSNQKGIELNYENSLVYEKRMMNKQLCNVLVSNPSSLNAQSTIQANFNYFDSNSSSESDNSSKSADSSSENSELRAHKRTPSGNPALGTAPTHTRTISGGGGSANAPISSNSSTLSVNDRTLQRTPSLGGINYNPPPTSNQVPTFSNTNTLTTPSSVASGPLLQTQQITSSIDVNASSTNLNATALQQQQKQQQEKRNLFLVGHPILFVSRIGNAADFPLRIKKIMLENSEEMEMISPKEISFPPFMPEPQISSIQEPETATNENDSITEVKPESPSSKDEISPFVTPSSSPIAIEEKLAENPIILNENFSKFVKKATNHPFEGSVIANGDEISGTFLIKTQNEGRSIKTGNLKIILERESKLIAPGLDSDTLMKIDNIQNTKYEICISLGMPTIPVSQTSISMILNTENDFGVMGQPMPIGFLLSFFPKYLLSIPFSHKNQKKQIWLF